MASLLNAVNFAYRICLWIHFLSRFSISALFEDQIGKFDWRKQYIGNVQFVKFSTFAGKQTSGNYLILATDQNVIASVSIDNGELMWRQLLGGRSHIDTLDIKNGNILVTSGDHQAKTLHSFDISKGSLSWDLSFSVGDCVTKPRLIDSINKGFVLIVCDRLYAVDESGDQLWSLSLSKYGVQNWHGISTSETSQLFVICKNSNGDLIVIRVDAKAGTVVDEKTLALDGSIDQCLKLRNKILCVDYTTGTFSSIEDEGASYVVKKILSLADGVLKLESVGSEAIAVISRLGHGQLFRLNGIDNVMMPMNDGIDNAIDLSSFTHGKESFVTFAASNQTHNSVIWLNRAGERKLVIRYENSPDIYGVQKVFPIVLEKPSSDRSLYRSVVISEDQAIAAFDEKENMLWIRQEALSGIISVEMLDLPLSESQASVESEFSTSGQNLVSMLVRRLTTQANQIQRGFLSLFNESLIFFSALSSATSTSDLMHIVKSVSSKTNSDSAPFERDYFNLHKIIVVVTAVGKVFGMDNRHGKILWQFYVPDLEPFYILGKASFPFFAQRTTAHYPFPAQCAFVGKNKLSGLAQAIFFDPVAGIIKDSLSLQNRIKQVVLLPVANKDELFGLAFLTENGQVLVYPHSIESPLQKFLADRPFFLFNFESSTNELIGYRLEKAVGIDANNKDVIIWSTEKVWTLAFPPAKDGKIVDVKMKRANEHMHSQGRVLGDRSVLYKYSNPNLVALTFEKIDETKKSAFIIYLLDAVTGTIQFTLTHHRVAQPFHMVHCENWLVYSFYNEKARRTEFTVLELYEGKHQTDPDRFSSYVARPQLLAMRQSYIFPQGVSALAVTNTEKGITSRHLLVALPFGGIFELHKAFLDPRRVMAPTQEEREEGLIPYMPDLPIAAEHIINYNQSVFNIRAIHTSSAGLESTSLVLAYGLDLFYTRIHPSATFDVLKDDFDHWFISLMLLGLFLASIFTKRLAKLRDLKSAWK